MKMKMKCEQLKRSLRAQTKALHEVAPDTIMVISGASAGHTLHRHSLLWLKGLPILLLLLRLLHALVVLLRLTLRGHGPEWRHGITKRQTVVRVSARNSAIHATTRRVKTSHRHGIIQLQNILSKRWGGEHIRMRNLIVYWRDVWPRHPVHVVLGRLEGDFTLRARVVRRSTAG